MLESLEILNGIMTPKFDKYTDIYTIKVSNEIDTLSINYLAEESYKVSVINNSNFIEGENIVYINVSKDNIQNTYTLLVNKERVETTSIIDNSLETIEIPKEMPTYIPPLIGIICFLIILFTYTLLFRKRKHK